MRIQGWLSCALVLGLAAIPAWRASAAQMPGMAQLSGKVAAAKALGQLSVHAYNTDKRVAYTVYVVKGQYRATNLFPGHYEISVRGTVGQRNWSLAPLTVQADISASQQARVDFKLTATSYGPTYIGGRPYPTDNIAPYDVVYPPGRGRQVIENTCFGCHVVNFFPYNAQRTYPAGRTPYNRDGWRIAVDRMATGHAFSQPTKASYFDRGLLSPQDREALIDYLTDNFGYGSTPRVVQQIDDPALDEKLLERAEFVEYRWPNTPGRDNRYVHTPDFDGQGNVWIMDRGAEGPVRVDPRSAEITHHLGHGGGEFMTVDVDGTAWYGGLTHYDPSTRTHDEYKLTGGRNGRNFGVSTLVIDSQGDIWLSLLTTGGLGKFDRKANSVQWWDVPVLRSRPYGLTLDHDDKVWFADYHNSGITRFDPVTQQFRHYPLTLRTPTNIRRLSVDSKNFVWSATWGSPGLQRGALYRLNPDNGAVDEYPIGIPYTNPYDTEVDKDDNVWLATDNHVLKFDVKTRTFARYPVPTRTDIPKLAVTRDGAVWFGPRNAGQSSDYGGAAIALYPDKDRIVSFAAYYSPENARARKAQYRGPATPVTGQVYLVPAPSQNPCEYSATLGLEVMCEHDAASNAAPVPPSTIKGGAARE